jgi:hypothetical protein
MMYSNAISLFFYGGMNEDIIVVRKAMAFN